MKGATEGTQWAGSTCCSLKGRCRRSYPITPLSLSAPQRNAATRSSGWHLHGSSKYSTYANTHTFTPQVWSVSGCPCRCNCVLVVFKNVLASDKELNMNVLEDLSVFVHKEFQTSLWAGECQLCICDIFLLVPRKMTSASSLSLRRCCPWLPGIFALCTTEGVAV